MNWITRIACACLPLALAACATHRYDTAPAAEVERFETVSSRPAFLGMRFEDVGAYELVTGVAHLRVDPRHPANRAVVDLDKAPAPDGWVHFRTDVTVLRPVEPAKASRVMLVELTDHGVRRLPGMINEGTPDAMTREGAGTGYAMRRGYAMVWIGWQGDLPVATDKGRPIMGKVTVERAFEDVHPVSTMRLAWPASSLTQPATLMVRATRSSPPQTVPQWRFLNANEIEIQRPPGFDAGAIYTFSYQARDPAVTGLGYAALREVTRYLKGGRGVGNPMADIHPDRALVLGVGEGGQALREFIWQGFNADPRGGRVFDGAMPIAAGAGKGTFNARFAQAPWAEQFPFSYGIARDPVSGRVDGIFGRCEPTRTCPRLMHVDSSADYWSSRASLVTTDGAGHDITLPPEARAYLISSAQGVPAVQPATPGICKITRNPLRTAPLLRALLEDLVAWTRDGKEPPPSALPRVADGKLVPPQNDAVGFPDLHAFGIGFPRAPVGLAGYQVLVPMADADGHDIGGVRLPDVAVPLATHTGWNLRRPLFAEDELCDHDGMLIPLPSAARAGDTRLAIGQRYASRLQYAKEVALSARALRDQDLLLQEDVDHYIDQARAEPRVAP